MKTITFCILAFSVVGGSVLAHRLSQNTVLNPQKSVLIQQYKIEATSDFTKVSATTNFRDFANSRESYPQKVEFNGQPMQNDFLGEREEKDIGCQINNDLPTIRAMPTPKPQPNKSVFSLFQEGYRKDNIVTIYHENGETQSYTISFEPVEFAQPDSIVLSRSKDNVVKLKGKGSPEKDSPIFGLSWMGNFVDEKAFRYDKENALLYVSAKSLKKMKKGNANLWIISSDWNVIETPGILTGNSYIITYNDGACVQIVD